MSSNDEVNNDFEPQQQMPAEVSELDKMSAEYDNMVRQNENQHAQNADENCCFDEVNRRNSWLSSTAQARHIATLPCNTGGAKAENLSVEAVDERQQEDPLICRRKNPKRKVSAKSGESFFQLRHIILISRS